jgi:pyruvate/2-oxoglutarate dehydrogenase complex dihydrolipoamide acyltransferase (E2) component
MSKEEQKKLLIETMEADEKNGLYKTNNMAQQTAVEWLVEQLVELDKELDGRRKSDDSTVIKINPTKIYKQAKQMEKEQIVNAWMATDNELQRLAAEQYYNETYNK